MKLFGFLLSIALLTNAALAFGKIDPSYKKLKAFRNYYTVEVNSPLQHYIEVRFGSQRCVFAASRVKDIEETSTDWADCYWQSPEMPWAQLVPVPKKQQNLAQAAKEWAQKNMGAQPQLDTGYLGGYYQVRLKELIPGGPGTEIEKQSFFIGSGDYIVDKNFKKLAPQNYLIISHSIGNMAGHEKLCAKLEKSQKSVCEKSPAYVNYLIPTELSGTSLLTSNWTRRNQVVAQNDPYIEQWPMLEKAALSTVRKVVEKKYKSPLKSLLAQQGKTLLPENFQQRLTFDLELSGTKMIKEDTDSARLAFFASDAYTSGIPISYKSEKLGLLVDVIPSLKDMTLSVSVTNLDGVKATATYAIKKSGLIIDGTTVALDYGAILEQTDADSGEIEDGRWAIRTGGGYDEFQIGLSHTLETEKLRVWPK